ncbi:hypothetical protein [Mycoplasmopsis felis]|uniref:hypothetical protein n=1 Tax=Mycoplasmopsis felis TaxID=33923 RepID=UPI002AFFDC90|nr:hypothetical protein [Mycoplasmopsis felis]WQQ03214.1 hypothetical protein RRG38_03665 [Mycoplasmopsis felis]
MLFIISIYDSKIQFNFSSKSFDFNFKIKCCLSFINKLDLYLLIKEITSSNSVITILYFL